MILGIFRKTRVVCRRNAIIEIWRLKQFKRECKKVREIKLDKDINEILQSKTTRIQEGAPPLT